MFLCRKYVNKIATKMYYYNQILYIHLSYNSMLYLYTRVENYLNGKCKYLIFKSFKFKSLTYLLFNYSYFNIIIYLLLLNEYSFNMTIIKFL